MYERIVVATDTTRPATAVTIASALAAEINALELVTVAPPGPSADVQRVELQRLAVQHGWLPAACTVLSGDDIATTLLRHVGRRRAALLVIGSRGGPPWTRPRGGPITRQLLADSPGPVLVVGPHVDNRFQGHPGKLVVAVDRRGPVDATVDAVDDWVHTFGSGRSWVIEVVAPTVADDDADQTVMTWVDALERRDLPVTHEVLHGGVADSLDRFAAGVRNAVVVATSRRYSDGRRHLHSTTYDLIHCGRHPVLVVPDRDHREPNAEQPATPGPLALPT